MNTYIYHIKPGWAKHQNLPIYFAATPLVETEKALYLYGHGTVETARMGVCCQCGRALTHPVSVELGIGPICGAHYWDWDLVGGYTKENLKRLMKQVQEDIRVDCWVPKSVVKNYEPAKTERVEVPKDHPKLNQPKPSQKRIATMATLKRSGAVVVKIEFPFDRSVIEQVKTIPGRKFHPEVKCWSAPLSVDAVTKLKELDFTLDSALEQYLDKTQVNIDTVDKVEVKALRGKLYPFQEQGVSFIEAKDGRALIGDEMGLGKTIQALAYLQLHPEKRPALIVCPASLKLNWKREIEQWMNPVGTIEILQGTTPYNLTGDLIIINYDILDAWKQTLRQYGFQVMITDECHFYKNNKAKRTKAVKFIGKSIAHVIALSGTPIVNRPVEMFNAINLIDPTIFPTYWDYAKRYCGLRHNGFGWDFSGATNTQELHEKLTSTIMIRRLKKDVLQDLPDKVRSFTPIELSNQREYLDAELNLIAYLEQTKGAVAAAKASNAEVLTSIEVLKQLAVRGKLDTAIEWIRDFIDTDGKLVVFATHKFVIDRLMQEFGQRAVKVDGSVSGAGRDKAVQEFQHNNEVRLFVGNIKAAGVGLTLTAASNVAFLELPWTPGELSQAEDRCHRIGQKGSVNVYYLLAENTIEQKIARLLDRKRKVLDNVLDGKDTEQESLLTEIIKQFES